jgi:chromosome segregation ATPase
MHYEALQLWFVAAGEWIRATLFALLVSVGLLPAPCSQPLIYRVGQIDERFHLTKEEVTKALTEAEGLWETKIGKDLLQQDTGSGIPVNFVYDDRQKTTDAKKALEKELATLGVEKSGTTTEAKIAVYKGALKNYQAAANAYQAAVGDFNRKVEKINQNGGADASATKQLQKEAAGLQDRYASLETQRQAVNVLGSQTEQLITESNQLIDTYNQQIANFQKEYSKGEEAFDEGGPLAARYRQRNPGQFCV